jgi:hypothetical protein
VDPKAALDANLRVKNTNAAFTASSDGEGERRNVVLRCFKKSGAASVGRTPVEGILPTRSCLTQPCGAN